jgi:hypothetical protein
MEHLPIRNQEEQTTPRAVKRTAPLGSEIWPTAFYLAAILARFVSIGPDLSVHITNPFYKHQMVRNRFTNSLIITEKDLDR